MNGTGPVEDALYYGWYNSGYIRAAAALSMFMAVFELCAASITAPMTAHLHEAEEERYISLH